MSELHAIHVVLQGYDGRYLAGREGEWSFSEHLEQARVFDYVADRIPEQLELLAQDQGISLAVLTLDPRQRFETCDRCGGRMAAFKIFFDGHQYFCPDCRENS